MWFLRSHLALTLEPTGPFHIVMVCHIMAYLHLLIPPDRIPAELCLNALSLQGLYVPRSLRRAFPKHSTLTCRRGLCLARFALLPYSYPLAFARDGSCCWPHCS